MQFHGQRSQRTVWLLSFVKKSASFIFLPFSKVTKTTSLNSANAILIAKFLKKMLANNLI
jgi:hypothetical protein